MGALHLDRNNMNKKSPAWQAWRKQKQNQVNNYKQHKRAEKAKRPEIGCERTSKTWPIFFSLVYILEKIKQTFFFLSQPGTTRSIALPEHTYYFSKYSNKEGKGWKQLKKKKKLVDFTSMSVYSAVQMKFNQRLVILAFKNQQNSAPH